MTIRLTPEQSQALPIELPIEVTSPEGSVFYLLSADQYCKVRAILEDASDPRAFYPHMAKVFGPAGWDDPEMDVYDELDLRFVGLR